MKNDRTRRSFVIIAVLVVMGSVLFITTGALFIAQSEIAGAAGSGAAAQSRALAWSGVQIVIGELDQQRDRILRGETPRVEDQYEVYAEAGRLGVVRLLPITPDGERIAPEAGRLDINRIKAEQLAEVGMIDEALVEAIIAFRGSLGRPMHSIAELLEVPGVTPEMLYGPLDEIRLMQDALGEEGDVADRVLRRLASTDPRGLADMLTVYAFEPPLQRDGRLRINLNMEWSEELGRRLDDRFGRGASGIVKELMEGGVEFDTDRAIVSVLRTVELGHEEWPDILDALTTDGGEFHFGKIDINSASDAALMGLPGMSAEQAAQIVRAREGLSEDERATIVWPLLSGIVDAAQFEELVEHITVRSWTYRIRIAAGQVDAEEPRGELLRPVIWEAVIDLAAPKPRLAYLRDVTMLETASRIASNASQDNDDENRLHEPELGEEIEEASAIVAATNDELVLEDEFDDIADGDDQDPNEPGSAPSRIGRWKPG